MNEQVGQAGGQQQGYPIHQGDVAGELAAQGTVVFVEHMELAAVDELLVDLQLVADKGGEVGDGRGER